jgi:ubiquitin C-terminal hydrolase
MLEGLSNLGGTCYCNSLMQLLFHIQEIQDYFQNYTQHANYDAIQDQETKRLIIVLDRLKDIYDVINNKKKFDKNQWDNIVIKLLRNTIHYEAYPNDDYIKTNHEDSSELLNSIITLFHINNNHDNHKIKEFSKVLLNIYNHTIIEYIKVKDKDKIKCKDDDQLKSTNTDLLQHKVSQFNNGNLIDYMFDIKHTEDGESRRCSTDTNINIKKDKLEFYNIKSKYIIINVIPYRAEIVKLNGSITIKKTMLPFDISIHKSFSINNKKYKIKGVVIHNGLNVDYGHYIYLSFEDNKWVTYDDSSNSEFNYDTKANLKFNSKASKQPVLIIYEEDDTISHPDKTIVSKVPRQIQDIVNKHNIDNPIQRDVIAPLGTFNYNAWTMLSSTSNTQAAEPLRTFSSASNALGRSEEPNNNIVALRELLDNHFQKLQSLHDSINEHNNDNPNQRDLATLRTFGSASASASHAWVATSNMKPLRTFGSASASNTLVRSEEPKNNTEELEKLINNYSQKLQSLHDSIN